MSQQEDFAGEDKSDFSQKITPHQQTPSTYHQPNYSFVLNKQCYVEPPRQLPKRSYSLQPDMATGWKPKKIGGSPNNNVFPLTFSNQIVDFMIRELHRKKLKQWQIAYLGPRKHNSYLLHQQKKYENPYPIHKKLDPHISERPQIPMNWIFQERNLKFNSNFQCGNLDAAIFISPNEYDLFMRIDTNTKGHTNWYYFTVQNGNFVGSVRFNICNFRRQKSLYQRGLKPYFYSKKTSQSWRQGGENIRYEKRPLRYNFLYDQEQFIETLKTYITLTFTYHFQIPNDTVQLAYFIPYSYSRLLKFISTLKYAKHLPSFKSLSGLSIPILQITDEDTDDINKKVVIITARIHPGQSNSSFVCEGFLQFACSQEQKAKQYRQKFITFIIPMINPDGVIAGNYRTSLFGKDLNRTFNQTRRFAFPQTFHLLEFIKDLKAKYKQNLNLFIDLHGHSVKKNIFMYGPQFSIQQPNYYIAKELPRILSNLNRLFRYFSCIFRISSEKSTTARGTLNRYLNIPFTYTMESSNGFYYDSQVKKQFQLTSKKLKTMGPSLCQALIQFRQVENNRNNYAVQSNFHHSKKSKHYNADEIEDQMQSKHQCAVEDINAVFKNNRSLPEFNGLPLSQQSLTAYNSQEQLKQKLISQSMIETPPQHSSKNLQTFPNSLHQDVQQQALSDDKISEGNSDSQPQDEDLSDAQLDKLLQTIQNGKQIEYTPERNMVYFVSTNNIEAENVFKFTKFSQKQIKQKARYKKKNPLLPPINCLIRAQTKQKGNKSCIDQKLIDLKLDLKISPQKRAKQLSISQMIEEARTDIGLNTRKQQLIVINSVARKKGSKIELQKIKLLSNGSGGGLFFQERI